MLNQAPSLAKRVEKPASSWKKWFYYTWYQKQLKRLIELICAARPFTSLERLWRWLKRRVAVITAVCVLGGGAIATFGSPPKSLAAPNVDVPAMVMRDDYNSETARRLTLEPLGPQHSLTTFNPTTVAELIADINTANSNSQPDTIDLGGGTFTLTAVDNNIGGTSPNGLPVIQADGGNALTIQNGTIERQAGSPEFRFFQLPAVVSPAPAVTLNLNNVTLRGGDLRTTNSPGGAVVASVRSTLHITGSRITGNAAQYGGGIFVGDNDATLTVSDSTIADNTSTYGGGGIAFQAAASASATIERSTISGNQAAGSFFTGGGGLLVTSGAVNVLNSTVSGNQVASGGFAPNGGGIDAYGGNVTLRDVTIAGNTATTGAGINVGTAAVTVHNSILTDHGGDDFNGTINAASSNNLTDEAGFPGRGGMVTNFNTTLADNGGPTFTHALLSGSSAIDAIANGVSGCVAGTSTDQRGAVRADGANRGGTACDIGAYEYDSNQKPNVISLRDFSASGGPGGLAALWAGIAGLLAGLGLALRRRVGGQRSEVRDRKSELRPELVEGVSRALVQAVAESGRSDSAYPFDKRLTSPLRMYHPPAVVQRGALKQFAGSPLAPEPDDPLDILGLGG